MATTHTLTRADNLFAGDGFDVMAFKANGRKGAPVALLTRVSLGAPILYDADYLIKAATSTEIPDEAETVTYLASADAGASPVDAAASTSTIYPDGSTTGVVVWPVTGGSNYGRNVAAAVTHGSSVVAMTITVSGYDIYKRAMSETLTITAGTTSKSATGKKAFAYVKSVALTAAADASANTVNVGIGSVLGLPYKLAKIGDVVSTTIGGAQELINVASNATVVAAVTSTASATTGDTRGTITYTTALDGSAEPIVWMYVDGRNTQTGLVGVTQA